jgi:hypothetical protein
MTEEKDEELAAIEEEIEEGAVETAETQSDAREDAELPQDYGSPEEVTPENVHTFLKRAIFDTPYTTKVANLKQPELGQPQIPVRTWLNIALSFKMRNREGLNKYCMDKANIITDTSLSRDATSLKMAVTQKKEVVRLRHKTQEGGSNG